MTRTNARRHSLRRGMAVLLAVCLLLASLPVWAAAEGGAAAGTETREALASNNQGANRYINARRWTQPTNSYLYPDGEGGLIRVEYVKDGGQAVINRYDSGFRFQSGRSIPAELPLWGGFFAGEDYNFMVFGQENPEESDAVEVIRVVKYGKDWQRLGAYSLYGGNTKEPFSAGSLDFAEHNGELFIHTCHTMYKSQDGANHQASMSMRLRERDMASLGGNYMVAYTPYGYTSHSFNQFVLIDQEGNFVTMDHGDAYPRALVINRKPISGLLEGYTGVDYDPPYGCGSETIEVLKIPGQAGDNDTGLELGGFAETSSLYVSAYSYDEQGTGEGEYCAYMSLTFKDSLLSENVRMSYPGSRKASTPMLVPTDLEGGWVLWNTHEYQDGPVSLHFAKYLDGGIDFFDTAFEGVSLSDCQPVSIDGKAVWYTTYNGLPTFYRLGDEGLETFCDVAFVQEGGATLHMTTGPDGKLSSLPQAEPREGLEFAGWYQSPEGGEQAEEGAVFARSTTLYARWLPEMAFEDVPGGEWFHPAVKYVFQQGLMKGVSDSSFDPKGTTSRAMITTILYRMAGSPNDLMWYHFQDVRPSDWYYEAVAWASGHQLVDGYDFWTFGPNDPITREQLAVMLYRFNGSPAVSGGELSYPDAGKVSSWAKDAMLWATGNGIISGKSGRLDPKGKATRAETAAILQRVLTGMA